MYIEKEQSLINYCYLKVHSYGINGHVTFKIVIYSPNTYPKYVSLEENPLSRNAIAKIKNSLKHILSHTHRVHSV
jgi:hypothetical protein